MTIRPPRAAQHRRALRPLQRAGVRRKPRLRGRLVRALPGALRRRGLPTAHFATSTSSFSTVVYQAGDGRAADWAAPSASAASARRRLRRAPALRRARQEPADPHQELPERGDEEGAAAARVDRLRSSPRAPARCCCDRRSALRSSTSSNGRRWPMTCRALVSSTSSGHDQSRVALISKHGIVIATRKLEQLCIDPRDHPHQVGGMGRQRHLLVFDAQPHQVPARQRRPRHHPHARRADLPVVGVQRHAPLRSTARARCATPRIR